jgi:uncharacterized membrane protein YuzA (DUF378 family)
MSAGSRIVYMLISIAYVYQYIGVIVVAFKGNAVFQD